MNSDQFSGSYWNTRVIRKYDDKSRTTYFEIHEVHYDTNHKIISWTKNAVKPFGNTLNDLREDVKHFSDALEKPILELEHCDGQEQLVEVRIS